MLLQGIHYSWIGRLVCSAVVFSGCASLTRVRNSAEALRWEVEQRLPAEDARTFVVPFEVDEAYVKMARDAIFFGRSPREQAEELIKSLSSKNFFGVVYDDWATLTANESLGARRGNCFAFASILVGLARALNLHAVYAEFSARSENVQHWGPLLVRAGHITAMIPLGQGNYTAIEFGEPVRYGRWHIISDLEATAHYYNNRGVERIIAARNQNVPIPWQAAAHDLRLATELVDTFYRAWNNLGVVTARLGRKAEAVTYYRRAIEHNQDSPSAHTNLGALLLELDQPVEAEPILRRASELEDENADVFHLLGLACWENKKPECALEALDRALELDPGHEAARNLLGNIREARARHSELGWPMK